MGPSTPITTREADRVEAWRATDRIAWTDGDGPGRPPGGVDRRAQLLLAIGLGAAMSVLVFGDGLCPEHRAWVRALAVIGIALSASAIAATMRASAAGPMLALGAAVTGTMIGVIDAAHDMLRGSLVTIGFAFAGVLGAYAVVRQGQSARWSSRLRRDLDPLPSADMPAPAVAATSTEGQAQREAGVVPAHTNG